MSISHKWLYGKYYQTTNEGFIYLQCSIFLFLAWYVYLMVAHQSLRNCGVLSENLFREKTAFIANYCLELVILPISINTLDELPSNRSIMIPGFIEHKILHKPKNTQLCNFHIFHFVRKKYLKFGCIFAPQLLDSAIVYGVRSLARLYVPSNSSTIKI